MNFSGLKLLQFAVLIPLAFFAIIVSWQYHLPSITADGHTYLQIARNIHYGVGLGWQALWASPLHSILIALVAWFPGAHDLLFAAGIVSILMGTILTISLYFLAKEIFNWKTGVIATIVVLSFPHTIALYFVTEPEITYTAFLYASLALLLAAARKNSSLLAVLAGISFSLAYLSRSEGFLIMVITLVSLCATQGFQFYKTSLAKLCLIVMVMFFITSSPYLGFLKKHYGAFVISPKASYVMIWMKSQVYHDNDKDEADNDDLWGLTPEGKLKWQQPTGMVDLVNFLMSHPAKSFSVYLHNLSQELPGRIPNSSGRKHFPQVYPPYIALLALLAAFLGWGKDSLLKKSVLYSPLLVLLILPVFTGGWSKYLLPYAPLLIIAASGGLFQSTEKLKESFTSPCLRRSLFLLSPGIMAILAIHFLSVYAHKSPDQNSSDRSHRLKIAEYMRDAGLMARQNFGPGHNYMVNWNKMIYYLDGFWTPFPNSLTLTQALRFAHQNNVDYVVRELEVAELNKSDEELYEKVLPGLKIAGIYRSEDLKFAVVFYELLGKIR